MAADDDVEQLVQLLLEDFFSITLSSPSKILCCLPQLLNLLDQCVFLDDDRRDKQVVGLGPLGQYHGGQVPGHLSLSIESLGNILIKELLVPQEEPLLEN